MDYEFRTIKEWIGAKTPYGRRQRSRFASTYKQTLTLLERELSHLNAKQIVIQTYHFERDIRQDGMPRADARVPSEPGVILSFNSKHGPLSYPCDTFDKWQDNLRAIALALEALRTVDRYGVTKTGEQYKGWKALPAAAAVDKEMTEGDAVQWISLHSGERTAHIMASQEKLNDAYRKAGRKLHPEAGGSHTDFVKLNQAVTLLRKRYQ
jgi:hypothetical protein